MGFRVLARRAAILLAVFMSGTMGWAQTPDDEVVLTVSGAGDAVALSINDLRAIAEATIETSTIWTDGVQVFTGIPLDAFVRHFQVTDGDLVATALNDYEIRMPVADALQEGPIIAYLRNGETMSVRDKGPLWLVYPYDARPEYQTEIFHSRSIWQLDKIRFETE